MFRITSIKRFFRAFFVKASSVFINPQRNSATRQESQDMSEPPRNWWKNVSFIALVLFFIYFIIYHKAASKSLKVYISDVVATAVVTETPIEVKGLKLLKDRKPKIPHRNTRKDVKEQVKIIFPSKERIRFRMAGSNLPLCKITVSGKLKVNTEVNTSIELENLYPTVAMGGYYTPRDCRAKHKVAILVPYRDRKKSLWLFLYHIHPFLMNQKIEYQIFIFEQSGTAPFNKGRLFNAGFNVISKNDDWHCIVFHNVDLLPADKRILYTCPVLPKQMLHSIVKVNRTLTFPNNYFAGVTGMMHQHYRSVNGYSNLYWGEERGDTVDMDMFERLSITGLGISRYKNFARYVAINDTERSLNISSTDTETPHNKTKDRYKTDGLYDLSSKVKKYWIRHLSTHIVIDVDPAEEVDYYK